MAIHRRSNTSSTSSNILGAMSADTDRNHLRALIAVPSCSTPFDLYAWAILVKYDTRRWHDRWSLANTSAWIMKLTDTSKLPFDRLQDGKASWIVAGKADEALSQSQAPWREGRYVLGRGIDSIRLIHAIKVTICPGSSPRAYCKSDLPGKKGVQDECFNLRL